MVWQCRKEKEDEQSSWRSQHNHGHMISHIYFSWFPFALPLSHLSVSELICHMLFLSLHSFSWVLVHFWKEWWEIQYGYMFGFLCLVCHSHMTLFTVTWLICSLSFTCILFAVYTSCLALSTRTCFFFSLVWTKEIIQNLIPTQAAVVGAK